MATLTVLDPTSTTSVDVTTPADAAGGGDQFKNTGKELLLVKNGSVSSITVTVARPTPSNYGDQSDVSLVVGAGLIKVLGPFPTAAFNDEDGYLQLTYSAVTTLDVAVIRGR